MAAFSRSQAGPQVAVEVVEQGEQPVLVELVVGQLIA